MSGTLTAWAYSQAPQLVGVFQVMPVNDVKKVDVKRTKEKVHMTTLIHLVIPSNKRFYAHKKPNHVKFKNNKKRLPPVVPTIV